MREGNAYPDERRGMLVPRRVVRVVGYYGWLVGVLPAVLICAESCNNTTQQNPATCLGGFRGSFFLGSSVAILVVSEIMSK